MIESTFISVLPLFTLANSDPLTGNEASFLQAGMTAFTVIVLVVNFKLFFVQSKWYYMHYVVMGASIGLYFACCSFINSFLFLDFDFYQVWNHLLRMQAFWLTVLLLTLLIAAKDIYISGLERNFNFKPWHIIQEVSLFRMLSFTPIFSLCADLTRICIFYRWSSMGQSTTTWM